MYRPLQKIYLEIKSLSTHLSTNKKKYRLIPSEMERLLGKCFDQVEQYFGQDRCCTPPSCSTTENQKNKNEVLHWSEDVDCIIYPNFNF